MKTLIVTLALFCSGALLAVGKERSAAHVPTPEEMKTTLSAKMLPAVNFRNLTVVDCVKWMKEQGIPLEVTAQVLRQTVESRITLKLRDVPALELVKYFTNQTDTKYRFEKGRVILRTLDDVAFEPVKEWNLPPTIFGKDGPPKDLKAFLLKCGTSVPDWGFAKYDPKRRILTVKSTADDLDRLDSEIQGYQLRMKLSLPVRQLPL